MDGQPFAYAGFWRRAAAFLIDLLIVAASGFLLLYTLAQAWLATFGEEYEAQQNMQLMLFGSAVLLLWLYSAGFEGSHQAGTPGKRALRLAVRRADGGRIGFWRASLRFLGKLLSTAMVGFGFLLAALTSRKQGLEDLVSGTIVVRRGRG